MGKEVKVLEKILKSKCAVTFVKHILSNKNASHKSTKKHQLSFDRFRFSVSSEDISMIMSTINIESMNNKIKNSMSFFILFENVHKPE